MMSLRSAETNSSKPEGESGSRRRAMRLTQFQAVALLIFCLSLGMSLWQLSVPEFLSSYDSGVYLAATIHLVSGVLPYRDFTFVQPPGILLLMSPVGVFSRFFGTHDGFILARIVSSVVTALNAGLLAWIVRHRGRLAMALVGGGLAFLPVSFFVSSSLTLEPYCILFVLLGVLAVIDRDAIDEEIRTRRFVVGGLLFGFAALIKLWAIFPLVALVICLVPKYRRRVAVLVAAATSCFVVLALPFFLSAPHHFISEVFGEQLFRQAAPIQEASIGYRLTVMTGFGPTTIAPSIAVAKTAFVILIVLVAASFAIRVPRGSLDGFFILAAIFVGGALLYSAEFFPYYGYFLAPFLLGVVGLSIARLVASVRATLSTMPMTRTFRRVVRLAGEAGGALIIFALVLYITSFYSAYAWGLGLNAPEFAAITNRIPAGSCVVYSEVSYGVEANRWTSSDPNCPTEVDPLGMWMAWGYQTKPATAAFARTWKSYFERAHYVVLSEPVDPLIGWNANLVTWFSDHFRLTYHHNYVFIYRADGE
jgi:hypothetical protein